MKTFMTGLLKGRITRWSMVAAVLTAAGLSLAWMGEEGEHFRFGGLWIGTDSTALDTASVWTAVQVPLDSAGRIASARVAAITRPQATADLLELFGADSQSEALCQFGMIKHDTAPFTMVGYVQKAGLKVEMKAILLYSGTWRFTGPDSAVLNFTLKVYPPSADGFPHGDPLVTIPGLTTAGKRVPLP